MKSRFLNRIISGVLGIIFISIFLSCSPHTPEEPRAAKAEETTIAKSEYAGSETCKECHWREHDSWEHTLHSKSMQSAGEDTIVGDFERNNKLVVKVADNAPKFAGREIVITMFKKDGRYFVNAIGPDWEFHDYEVAYVNGVNRKQHYLTIFPNGSIHVLPVEWDVTSAAWMDNYGLEKNTPGNGYYWSDDGMIWQFKCGGCHTTGMKINYDKASDSFNTKFTDIGVGCEVCHGPGGDHIAAARLHFYKERETIVNPAKMPWRIRSAICGQCHSFGVSTAKITPFKEGFPERYAFPYGFKAGNPLHLYFIAATGGDEVHHQYSEWKESAHAEAAIMCTTCHSVHQAGLHLNPNKAQTKDVADTLCTKCHKTTEKRAAHRIHTFGSCIACHMPLTTAHRHSHTFKFISPEVSIRAGGVDKQSNSCSGCHHHEKSDPAGLLEFLDAVKKKDMPMPFSVHKR